ncbi:MAG TPA: SRPBCC domain-containing protein [Candidatus Saccharimonadales bacterium]|nr:SRPBCC domain-containing protein [Candidatus Saccharimonadales bacterium]
MNIEDEATAGKTRDRGWEIGVRRTLPMSARKLWETLVTQPGLGYWFSSDDDIVFHQGAQFETSEDTTAEVVGFKRGELIRMRWHPSSMNFPSTLQVRVLPSGKDAVLAFHHDRLESSEQREEMQEHWSDVIDQFEELATK